MKITFVDPLIFIISFSLGILYLYLNPTESQIIIKYPTIYNAGKIKYTDDSDMCYIYDVIPTDCNVDKNLIFNVPLQTKIHDSNAESQDGHSYEPMLYRLYKYLFNK